MYPGETNLHVQIPLRPLTFMWNPAQTNDCYSCLHDIDAGHTRIFHMGHVYCISCAKRLALVIEYTGEC